jgi:hypothetical protein
VGNYAKADARRAELIEDMRRFRIMEHLFGKETSLRQRDHAIWLFCPYCARRKLTDVSWFSKHIKADETANKMLARLPCLGCGRVGLLRLILAPAKLYDMRTFLKSWDISDLILQEREQ